MKIAVIWVASLLIAPVVVVASAQSSPQQEPPQPKPVHFAVTTADVRNSFSMRTDVLLLWNRNERATPIGNGIKACVKAGSGGLLGGGLMSCSLTLSLPLGKVTAQGIVHNINRYTLVITGGTGEYENANGPLFVRRVADGVRRLTFAL